MVIEICQFNTRLWALVYSVHEIICSESLYSSFNDLKELLSN